MNRDEEAQNNIEKQPVGSSQMTCDKHRHAFYLTIVNKDDSRQVSGTPDVRFPMLGRTVATLCTVKERHPIDALHHLLALHQRQIEHFEIVPEVRNLLIVIGEINEQRGILDLDSMLSNEGRCHIPNTCHPRENRIEVKRAMIALAERSMLLRNG